MKRILLTYSLFLLPILAFTQHVNLLKDINTGTNASGSSPSSFTNVAGTIFFTANDPEHGTELWKTNGTAVGTVLVKDIRDGSGSSSLGNLVAIGSTLYFRANDGVNGSELWKSDGTDAGTVMVKDINPLGSSSPYGLTNVNGTLYLAANDGTNGTELWKSDGSTAGTVLVKDIYTGATGSSPDYLVNANGTLYFSANTSAAGTELWKSDGTSGGTVLIEDLNIGTGSSFPSNLVYNGSAVVFSAFAAFAGYELWRSDGTAAGTYLIEDINSGTSSSNPTYLTVLFGTVYFSATTAFVGTELWKSDGTTVNGASVVSDFVAGTGSSSPQNLTVAGSTIFFSAQDAAFDRELYKTTGTSVTLVSNINSTASSSPTDFEAAGSTVYFTATTVAEGAELWFSNGTSASPIVYINPGATGSSPSNKAFTGAGLLFAANNGTQGSELYLYNGTSTSFLKDINGGSEDASPGSFVKTPIITTAIYFQAYTNTNGYELWTTNGTSGGTTLVRDINLGTNNSYAQPIAHNGSLLFLRADNGTNGEEPYKSDGTSGGTTLLSDINPGASSSSMSNTSALLGSTLIFSAYDPTFGTELWKSDGTTTARIADINAGSASSSPTNFILMGSYVYFSATDATDGTELWRTNGTTASKVRDINIGGSSSPQYLTVIGSTLYFSANNGVDGQELYKSDGTSGGTVLVKDIEAGAGSSFPYQIVNANGTLFFAAYTTANSTELWKSDGTSGGTVLVKDIVAGSGSSGLSNITAVGSNVYFYATETATGYELYKSDGSSAGTVIVKDIFPGTTGSFPTNLTNINGTLYFSASNGTGNNLMKTNGTPEGTVVATSSGLSYQSPSNINYMNGNVYFVATNNAYGNEIFYVLAEPLNQPSGISITGSTASTQNVSFAAASGTVSGYIALRKAGSASTDLPVDGAPYFAGDAIGSSTVAYRGSGTNFVSSGLSASTVYHYSIYSYIFDGASNAYIYKPHNPLQGNASTIAAEPTTQASGIAFSSLGTTSITVNFTNGNGSSRVLVAKAGTAVDTTPADASVYTANAAFGAGSQIGTGNYVVGSGNGPITVTGLSAATTYHFKVFELNGAGALTNYNTATATNNPSSSSTVTAEPTVQASGLAFSSITSNSVTVNFTNGNGASRGLVAKAGSAVDGLPIDGTPYTFNTVFGSGSQIGTGNYAVGLGAGPITVTGLSPGVTYHFRVFEFNGASTTINYNISTATQNPNSAITLVSVPSGQPIGLTFPTRTSTSLGFSFGAATGPPTGYLVLRKQGSSPAEIPVNGTVYTAGSTFGSSKVVAVGNSLNGTDSGLSPEGNYFYSIFSYNGSGASTTYLTTSPLQGNTFTLATAPTAQPTSLVFSNVGSESLTGTFIPATGTPSGYLVIRKEGSAPTGNPTGGSTYVVGDAMGDAIVAYVGPLTTFNDSQNGLIGEATFHYKIFSFNGATSTVNYLTTTPLANSQLMLAYEPPSQPTNLVFSNFTASSFSVSFTNATGFPTGYLAIRRTGGSPTGVPQDGTIYTVGAALGDGVVAYVGTGNTFNESVAPALFSYDVFSYNGSTGTINYLTTNPLEKSLVLDTTPPQITNETSAFISSPATTQLKIVATIVENESSVTAGSVKVEFRSISTGASFSTPQDMVLNTGKWEFSIPATENGELGIEYKITATNTQTLNSTVTGSAVLSYSDALIPYTAFGTAVSNYRIISMPLDLTSKSINDVFVDDLGASDKTNWRMFSFDNSGNKNVEMGSSSNIETGKGYWLLVKDSKNLDTGPGKTVTTSSTAPYSISLVSGWNLIGNPYNFNVLWDDVLTASGVTGLKVITFDGSYNDAGDTKLNKFEGGFVLATTPVTLKFPVIKNPSAGREIAAAKSKNLNTIDQPNWEVIFTLRNGNHVRELGGIGMNENASMTEDQYDGFTLPRFMDYLELNHAKRFLSIPYSKDIIPSAQNHEWEFIVETNLIGKTELLWNNSYFGNNETALVLWDELEKRAIDMKQFNNYSTSAKTSQPFKIFYGNKSFVQEKIALKSLRIHSVSPNPTYGQTQITFSLAGTAESRAKVRVLNLLGQPVSTVFDGMLAAGYHEVSWNGQDDLGSRPAQGVYLVEVSQGQFYEVLRLVVK